jgi:hypothetical protein
MNCTSREEAVALIQGEHYKAILTLGKFYTAQNGRTITISEDDWLEAFPDLEDGAESAGLYCFWLLNSGNQFTEEHRTHWIQGKKYVEANDLQRIHPNLQAVGIGLKADGNPTVSEHLFHKTIWSFPQVDGRVPLYIGKTSNLLNRIKLHLSWPETFENCAQVELRHPPNVNMLGKEAVRKNNTSTQFRSCYEFLFRDNEAWGDTDDEARFNQIGLTIIPTAFEAVQERFYWEDYLVGRYEPPFNVDSER